MTMTPTQDLKHEHDIVKHALQIMDKLCDRVETGEKPNVEHITKLLEFLREFVDKCHHAKEEELLFPTMEHAAGQQVKPMITQMLAEHETGRAHISGMKQAFADYKAGQPQAVSALIENARGYIMLLNSHIVKEDTILYEVADQILSPQQQQELAEGFETIEAERTGPGKHEEYHQLIHYLEQIYVKQSI
jgi:hemerythrin-like domain-containing protein